MSVTTTALDALLGGGLGALARLAPEVIAIFDKRNERRHEKEMAKLNLEFEKTRHENAMDIKDLEVEQSKFGTAMTALTASIQSQAQHTGVRWVDALSATVRPVITYWLFFIYACVKIAVFSVYQSQGLPADQALVAIWGPDDTAMLSAVLTFWYVGRVWERDTTRNFRLSR